MRHEEFSEGFDHLAQTAGLQGHVPYERGPLTLLLIIFGERARQSIRFLAPGAGSLPVHVGFGAHSLIQTLGLWRLNPEVLYHNFAPARQSRSPCHTKAEDNGRRKTDLCGGRNRPIPSGMAPIEGVLGMIEQESAQEPADEQQAAGTAESEPTRISRKELYKMVWSEPMLKVAARFGVSSSYMARVCTVLNVPRPERGYWAKREVGKAPKKQALPPPRPGDLLEWARGKALDAQPARSFPQPLERYRRGKRRARRTLPEQHPLLADAKPLFEAGRLSWDAKYLKPAKKLLVDLAVTRTGLDSALDFANQLFLAFEAHEHRVVIAPTHETFRRAEVDEREKPKEGERASDLWSPLRCTVVYVGTVAFGLTVIEVTERAEARYRNGDYVRLSEYPRKRTPGYRFEDAWTISKNFPTGRLCLQVYSPYPRTEWLQQWRETPARPLFGQIPRIVRQLEAATGTIARLVEEGERQAELERQRWQIQREKWRREAEVRRAAEALKASRDELNEIIEAWAEEKRIEHFFADAERRLAVLADEDMDRLGERLQRARELVKDTDPLAAIRAWKTPEERTGD